MKRQNHSFPQGLQSHPLFRFLLKLLSLLHLQSSLTKLGFHQILSLFLLNHPTNLIKIPYLLTNKIDKTGLKLHKTF